jgi:hypothetical protein
MSLQINLNKATGNPSGGAIPAQIVTANGTYDLVADILVEHVNKLTLTGIVSGTGPVTGLELTFQSIYGGTEVVMLKDSDFSTASDTLLRTLGLATPTNLVTGSVFQITVDLYGALSEVRLRAKSAAGALVAVEVLGT